VTRDTNFGEDSRRRARCLWVISDTVGIDIKRASGGAILVNPAADNPSRNTVDCTE